MNYTEHFEFTWTQFTTSFALLLQKQFGREELKDVTLVSDDNFQIEAHKIILCANSDVVCQ